VNFPVEFPTEKITGKNKNTNPINITSEFSGEISIEFFQ